MDRPARGWNGLDWPAVKYGTAEMRWQKQASGTGLEETGAVEAWNWLDRENGAAMAGQSK